MEEQFVSGKTYLFQVVGMHVNSIGINMFSLRYGDRDTYRVRAFSFQEEDPDNLPKTILCYVSGIDPMTGFPYLRQDKESALRQLYIAGEEYPFKVVDIKTDNNSQANYYHLSDNYGFEHRCYFTGEPGYEKNDVFCLLVEAINEKGYLSLKTSVASSTKPEFAVGYQACNEIDDQQKSNFEPEGLYTEYKSSIAFAPGKAEADIDSQLFTIVRAICSFINSEGGVLWIGVNDSGFVTGIEPDFAYLNLGDDEYNGSYKSTPDGYELKIRNTINRMCNGAAGTKIEFCFYRNPEGKLYCGISIKRGETPVFVNGIHLFQRAGNQVIKLKGDEIINFIKERCGFSNASVARIENKIDELKQHLNTTTQNPIIDQQVAGTTEIMPQIPLHHKILTDDEIWNYFSFYKDGRWSFQKAPVDNEDIEIEIPILKSQKDHRLVMCYDNGCVNVVVPSKVRSGRTRSQRYANGWNTEAKFLNLFVTAPYNFIAAYSRDHEGVHRVKAHSITDFNPVESIKGKGAMIVNPKLGQALAYKQVVVENKHAIPNLILEKRFTSQSLGYRLTDPAYRSEISFVERL